MVDDSYLLRIKNKLSAGFFSKSKLTFEQVLGWRKAKFGKWVLIAFSQHDYDANRVKSKNQ